ncbi:hypothetical protein AURDEDRAFT_151079 [Auricularia subglabra TFB-10046 SS5]|nr:hypothetical protein AURDEDRAFT_151079 [Auricularia subglabra TFB-10046 SS5]
MAGVSVIPEELLSSVFDWLDLGQLVVASHVCQLWRRLAFDHRRFWGTAALQKALDPPALEFFCARLAEARAGRRPVTVTVWPNRGLSSAPDYVPIMQNRIIPAIAATLSHITALHLEVPRAIAPFLFAAGAALQQPAPALRALTITNWHSRDQGQITIPANIFTGSAPQLTSLSLGDGVALPGLPVPAFQAVTALKTLTSCDLLNTVGLPNILAWFPRLRDLDTHARGMREQTLAPLTPQNLQRLSQLNSLSLHVMSLNNMQELGIAISPIPTLQLNVFSRDTAHPEITLDHAITRLVLPQGLQELYCWLQLDQILIKFRSSQGLYFWRSWDTPHGYTREVPIWKDISTYPALVALSVHVAIWNSFLRDTNALPALESLAVTLKMHLPRQKALGNRPIPSPRLQTVVFRTCPSWQRNPEDRAIVTCRGIDEFLRASFVVDDWASLRVVLDDLRLYGPETSAGTKISCVTPGPALTQETCSSLDTPVATLLQIR